MFRTLSSLLCAALAAGLSGCQSSPKAPNPAAQSVVESLAAKNPDIVRLTVHQPRADGTHRRPLAFDRRLRPKPAYDAISRAFRNAPKRELLWELEK